jgi:1-phosphofructokinase
MIYTVTFNPSIDYVIQLENFKVGEVNRIESEHKYPGGKGINVSRVLNNFSVENVALGFLGGFTGEFINNFLTREGVKTDFVKINEDTRINVKLKAEEETEINGAGPVISHDHLESLYEKLNKLKEEDIIVLAGNVQKNLPRDIYSQIQERLKDKKLKFVVDTTGEALVSTLKNKPFLIKPNSSELEEIFGVNINTREEIINYGEKLLNMGAENVVVSMAAEGALLICKDGVYHASAPKGEVKNSVGAGDSLIAGFIAQFTRSGDIVEAFRWGAATGSATAFSLDLCSESYVKELIDQVKITKVNKV